MVLFSFYVFPFVSPFVLERGGDLWIHVRWWMHMHGQLLIPIFLLLLLLLLSMLLILMMMLTATWSIPYLQGWRTHRSRQR